MLLLTRFRVVNRFNGMINFLFWKTSKQLTSNSDQESRNTTRHKKKILEVHRISSLDSQKKRDVTWWAVLTSVNSFSWRICKCSQGTWCKCSAVLTESRSQKSGNICFYTRLPKFSFNVDSFCIGTDRTPRKKKYSLAFVDWKKQNIIYFFILLYGLATNTRRDWL